MKASLNWIKELLPALKASAKSIERKLTDVGLEVEEVIRQADKFEHIVAAEVRALQPHPGADRLRLATVFDGEGEQTVVCGAPNVEVGQKIVFARLGAKLPAGFTIEPRKIRGVKSEGMICSEAELGLGGDGDGIMVLAPRVKPGKPIAKVLGQTDVIFEIAATPNRPDVLSHLGLARELAAIYGLVMPAPTVGLTESGEAASSRAKIEIRSSTRCTRYVGRVIEGVKVGPSPAWVVRRLEAVGLRPISNVVDATNLALMELGHPLHGFDLDKLAGRRIIVRKAKDGEKLKTIDEVERTLTADDLVIADGKVPVALAGVMGGADSEVGAETTNVLLEAAMFDPRTVRRSAKRHALHTDASHRFERGADPLGLERGIDRCAALILELAGGTLLSGRIEVVEREHEAGIVGVRPERASLVLGRPVDKKEVRAALLALGLKKVAAPRDDKVKKKGKKSDRPPSKSTMFFSVPSWRVDLNREEDLIEEVARMTGYDSIPTIMPSLPPDVWTTAPKPDPAEQIRDALVADGFSEAISLAFNSKAQLDAMGFDTDRGVLLANPLGEESAIMRMSLLPALLRGARHNQTLLRTDLRLFELGHSFEWASPPGKLPVEHNQLAMLMRGLRAPKSWVTDDSSIDDFDLKATLERLLAAFAIDRVTLRACECAWLHPRSAVEVLVGDVVLGVAGELHPDVADKFELDGPALFVAELDVDALESVRGATRTFSALPRFPAVGRDLSFFIDRNVAADTILDTVRAKAEFLEDVRVFDVYEGKGLPAGKRSIAVSMTFRLADRTLTDAEVDGSQSRIMSGLTKDLGAEIRSGP